MLIRLAASARNGWRQLTSMRTALMLLFLLALAAIPGSVLPQRSVSIEEVNAYFVERPDLAPVLDRLGGFDVYGSPWFSAIYLLLFVSLVGCVVPRLRDHLRSLRRAPVDAPRRLSRLPQHADQLAYSAPPAAAAEALRAGLRSRRWRAVVRGADAGPVTVSAEKGYLKETGNLLMHFAMLAVLVGVALGATLGWHGNTLVVAGPDHRFCNVLQQYDEFGLGTRAGAGSLPPFCFTLTDFDAEFTEGGQPTAFLAHGEVSEGGGDPRPVEFTVNSPLRLDGASVYLLGNGYAPVLRYTDRFGETQTSTTPFLPSDPQGTAQGVATFPDANVDPAGGGERDPSLQVAFQGLYLPTAPAEGPLVGSVHPEERAPTLFLQAFRGDLGIDSGTPQSVLELNQAQLDSGELAPVGEAVFLAPGETMTLADETTVEFVGTQRWVTISVRHDPGQPVALVGIGLLLAGLVGSLVGRRRRVWFRVTADPATPGHSLVEAAGLPRSDYSGFATEFSHLLAALPLTPIPDSELQPAGRST
ncbi:MAG: cytochrome c biogenesis protein ResB [Micromonosporaceae bacterium]|nr:cytochrome c biogenesis protein ResB [Micromonosporaceae bacterium]